MAAPDPEERKLIEHCKNSVCVLDASKSVA